jgi:hypothetical protein
LLNLESNSNASFKDKDGKILIGTISGLEIYDPKFDKKNTDRSLNSNQSCKTIFWSRRCFKICKGIDSTTLLPKNS